MIDKFIKFLAELYDFVFHIWEKDEITKSFKVFQ